MSLQTRMYLLVGIMLGILYAVILGISRLFGIGNFVWYGGLAVGLVFLQYLIGPSMVGAMMRIKYVSEKEEPELHQMVADLAQRAGIKKPKVGISEYNMPNAFAFGRSQSDARVCVTRGIMAVLSRDELRAVLGHEITHVKNHDMVVITMLSVIPMICYYIAMSLIWGGYGGRRNQRDNSVLSVVGMTMMLLYFVTNLLVLYGSRIREYSADEGSVTLGSAPNYLATALYKLSYSNTRVSKEALRQTEGARTFFISDPNRALNEIHDLRQLDSNKDGVIDTTDLAALRIENIHLGFGSKLLEIFQTHPNMLRRVKRLATLA